MKPRYTLRYPQAKSLLRCFACVWVLIFFVLSLPSHAELSDEEKKRFEEVKRNIEKIKAQLEQTKNNRDKLQETLEENEKNIQKLNQKTQELKGELDQKQSKLNHLKDEQISLQKKKSEQANVVKDYVNAAYRLGKHSQVRLLLNQQEPAKIARMLKYYESFSESRSEKIALFIETLSQLESIEPEIAQETAKLQETYKKLKSEQAFLKNAQGTRLKTLSGLENDVKNQRQKLAGLEADRSRLEKLLTQVYEEINAQELAVNIGEFTKLKGKLPWPTKGKPKNRFGRNRNGSQFKWQGIEIGAEQGSDVIAIHHGQVIFSDYLRGHGLLMIIDHGSGYMSLYAHNENLYKELGEWVESGETISTVGDTGGRRDAALYFELRHNGKPTNPTPWFRSA